MTEPKQPEPIKAWVIEDTDIVQPEPALVVIGTEADARMAAEPMGDRAWVSGPYEFTIAVKP